MIIDQRVTQLDLAWAAGFFDGEGCTTLSADGYLRVAVSQCHTEVLERFQAAVGAGVIRGPFSRCAGWRPVWHFSAESWDAEHVLDQLWPYLSEVKQLQADDCRARAKKAHRRGFCRNDLHRLDDPENGRAKDGRCRRCVNAKNLAAYYRRRGRNST